MGLKLSGLYRCVDINECLEEQHACAKNFPECIDNQCDCENYEFWGFDADSHEEGNLIEHIKSGKTLKSQLKIRKNTQDPGLTF